MDYFVPDIRCAEELGTETALQDKFGGLPWGLPDSKWPVCKDCGRPQSLLAQLAHDGDRLDLGRDGRVLFVFQCAHGPGMCATWDGGSGANACFVCGLAVRCCSYVASCFAVVKAKDLRDLSTRFHSHHFLNNLPGSVNL